MDKGERLYFFSEASQHTTQHNTTPHITALQKKEGMVIDQQEQESFLIQPKQSYLLLRQLKIRTCAFPERIIA